MKALQIVKYGDIKDSLAFNEVKKPSIQTNDVLIEVKAAAINPIDKYITCFLFLYRVPSPMILAELSSIKELKSVLLKLVT